ncbi:MAG: c-type cytochrome [Candidatus Tectomicrobia bacterium]|nr:c-type cytochrome [Candidatus Tectomicrobia bacterium]
MTVELKSFLSIFFVLLALFQFWSMFELLGRKEHRLNPRLLRRLHQVSGYTFVALYLLISYYCLRDFAAAKGEVSPRGTLHAFVAFALFVVLALKILIIRVYKQLKGGVRQYGLVVFVLALGVGASSTGYYYLMRATGNQYQISKLSGQARIGPVSGAALLDEKCTRCHDLSRVFDRTKTAEGWVQTVDRMRELLPGWIAAREGGLVAAYLAEIRGARASEGKPRFVASALTALNSVDSTTRDAGHDLFTSICVYCHYPDRDEDKVGPGLKGLFKKPRLPFSGRPATVENVLSQLRNPIDKMPSFAHLGDERLGTILAYLQTL